MTYISNRRRRVILNELSCGSFLSTQLERPQLATTHIHSACPPLCTISVVPCTADLVLLIGLEEPVLSIACNVTLPSACSFSLGTIESSLKQRDAAHDHAVSAQAATLLGFFSVHRHFGISWSFPLLRNVLCSCIAGPCTQNHRSLRQVRTDGPSLSVASICQLSHRSSLFLISLPLYLSFHLVSSFCISNCLGADPAVLILRHRLITYQDRPILIVEAGPSLAIIFTLSHQYNLASSWFL